MATVLPFPRTATALRRRREGVGAMGLTSLMLLERDGEVIPANVQRFDQPQGVSPPEKSPELLLGLLLWSELTPKKQERIRQQLRLMAYVADPDPMSLRLHSLLNGSKG
jgi:hypothetical protein